MNLLGCKKASLMRGSIAVITFLMLLGFGAILNYTILDNFKGIINQTVDDPSMINQTADRFLFGIRMVDFMFVIVLAMLILSSAILNRRIASSPFFFIFALFTIPLLGLISFFFNFVFVQLVSSSLFTTTLEVFPITMLICTNLHWVALINFLIGAVALYGKQEKGQFVT